MTIDKMVSIVIVNYDGKTHLEKCLQSIMKINYTQYEIIVVDNNSTDGSVELVQREYPTVKIIKLDKNYGFAEPNNIGAKNAKGEFLLFLNNDTVVTPDFITELVNAMNQDPHIAICQSLLLKPNGDVDSSGDFVDILGRAYSSHDIAEKIRYILSARAACMIIRRDTFLELGGFDESYFASFEDVELGWKSWLWGYKVVLVPTSVVYHVGGQTIRQVPEMIAFHGIKNNILLRLTNFDFIDSTRSIVIMAVIVLVRKLFRISLVKNLDQSFNTPNSRTIFKACIWILKNIGHIAKKRKVLNARKIRTNQELKKMGLITKLKN